MITRGYAILVGCLLSVLTCSCRAQEPLPPGALGSYVPGGDAGITIVDTEDGWYEITTQDGRRVVTSKRNPKVSGSYLYFRLSEPLRKQIIDTAWLAVTFLDKSMGVYRLQYNAASNPYTPAAAIALMDTEEWVTVIAEMPSPRFEGKQNGGADFRLECTSKLQVARIDIYNTKPKGVGIMSSERTFRPKRTNPPAPGMYYTFGNDTDPERGPIHKALGATSIESYVTWETVERQAEGKWDWSQWDAQVDLLQRYGLKWVPFLIVGPAYSTPDWFRASKEHVPCRCLEHGIDSKIESLWNPHLPKRIDRFLSAFAERYRKTGVIESVLLGIQGDFGEAIYSVWGGGWTFNIPGEYHNHAGFWCNDPYALANFRQWVGKRYRTVDALNDAWGTTYKQVADADFPGYGPRLAEFRERVNDGFPHDRRRWLDFVEWYRQSMTDFADWWMATTRKHFPNTPIYLCTGGDAPPEHGSDFAEQSRVSAKHGAGVRITNEASDYASNFVITRWVASAGRHYGAYFGFEPAGPEDAWGIVARIYNATASGANQLHDYDGNVINSMKTIDQQQDHFKYLFHVPAPRIPVALWYPNTAMTLKWGGFLDKARVWRDYTDFDFVDETMLRTGALDRHQVCVILHGDVMEQQDAQRIADWVRSGGTLILVNMTRIETVEGENALDTLVRAGTAGSKGRVVRVQDMSAAARETNAVLRSAGHWTVNDGEDRVYFTFLTPNRLFILNANEDEKQFTAYHVSEGEVDIIAKPKTITDVILKRP